MIRLPCVLLFGLVCNLASAVPEEEGIFAVFDTNHGSFTCELFYDRAPMAVANFVGLAEGSRAWLDIESGTVERRPFFDGVTFHRVIPGFMIQGGSRNGQGTDGPGYQFPDAFFPGLVHEKKGLMSMANSGLDTNGSQFFVTVAPTPWLDYKHIVFGEVFDESSMAVVEAISVVDRGANDRPVEPVVIDSVVIVRNGAAAEAFDVGGHGLPVVGETPARLHVEEGVSTVAFGSGPDRSYGLSYSNDLESWTRGNLVSEESTASERTFDVSSLSSGRNRQFYQVTEVDNSVIPEAYIPESLVGKTLDLDVSSAGLRIVLRPDDERTEENAGQWLGTGDFNDDLGLNLNYFWSQNERRGLVGFVLDGYVQFDLDLLFADEESGTFTGVVRTGAEPPPAVRGTFTYQDR